MFKFFARWLGPRRLVASGIKLMAWQVPDDPDAPIENEEITFMFFERAGRRSYTVHEFGNSRKYRTHQQYMGAVRVWLAGGRLPDWASPSGETGTPGKPDLRVVK